MTDPRNEDTATPKLTHAVILDGGMIVNGKGEIQFFSKTFFKKERRTVGPIVSYQASIDARLLNLFLYSPTLYQGCQRARMDANDLLTKFKALVTMNNGPKYKELVVQVMADLIALESAMDVAMTAAREGIDFEKVDTVMNTRMEIRSKDE